MPNSPIFAQQHQARLAAQLAGLVDSAMDGIITVDESQNIVLYNRAAEKIFGWTAEQVSGKPLEMLIPQRFRPMHAQQVRQFGSTGVTSRRMGGNNVIHGLRANGEEFPIDASISHLDTDEGKLYTVILRDVTERVQAQRELAAFASEATGIREQERTRIARELHDELAQSLTAMKMDAVWLRDHMARDPEAAQRKLGSILDTLDSAVASTRRIAADLRPLILDDLGLFPAIEWLVQGFSQRTGVPCELQADEDLDLQEPYATTVFRMVQESLQNVAKHARATQVQVRVECAEDGEVVLLVEDNGTGFSPSDPRKPQSLGLVGLRERAALLRGRVHVSSEPGKGTRVEARIPLQPAQAGRGG